MGRITCVSAIAGLQLIFFVLFICLISSTAHPHKPAEWDDFDKAFRDLLRLTRSTGERCADCLGMARITYGKEGPVCSGILLKPWILLTVDSCVTKRKQKLLSVLVTSRGRQNRPIEAKVKKVVFEPEYKNGNPSKLALLVVYGKKEWDVGEFEIPVPGNPPSWDLKQIPYVDEWETLNNKTDFAVSREVSVASGLIACGVSTNDRNCFCVYKEGQGYTYSKRDVGIPLYYKLGDTKVAIGMYTGEGVNKEAPAHLFHRLYSSAQWMSDFLRKHPEPPAAEDSEEN